MVGSPKGSSQVIELANGMAGIAAEDGVVPVDGVAATELTVNFAAAAGAVSMVLADGAAMFNGVTTADWVAAVALAAGVAPTAGAVVAAVDRCPGLGGLM